MYVMPGLIDLHVHQGAQQKAPESEYYNKLWLAHGVTTVRGVPFGELRVLGVREEARAARTRSPRRAMVDFSAPGRAAGGGAGRSHTPERGARLGALGARAGGDGLKVGAERPDLMAALLDEAKKHGLGSHGAPAADRRRADERRRRDASSGSAP